MNEPNESYIVVPGEAVDRRMTARGANGKASDPVSVLCVPARGGFHETEACRSCFMVEHTPAGRDA
jgi:hypothetical protein